MSSLQDLRSSLAKHEKIVKELKRDISVIQNKCKHDYVFFCVIYDPCSSLKEYKCTKCDKLMTT